MQGAPTMVPEGGAARATAAEEWLHAVQERELLPSGSPVPARPKLLGCPCNLQTAAPPPPHTLRRAASAVALSRSCAVCQLVTHFFRQYLLYITFEVLEPLWLAFQHRVQTLDSLDEVCGEGCGGEQVSGQRSGLWSRGGSAAARTASACRCQAPAWWPALWRSARRMQPGVGHRACMTRKRY